MLYIACLFLIITLCFTCGKRKIQANIYKPHNIMIMIVCIFLFSFFFFCYLCIYYEYHLLNLNNILARIYFIFLIKCSRSNLKGFQYQIWTSVKKSEMHLSTRTNFITFFCKLVALIVG